MTVLSLEEIYYIAEICAAILVVVSLFYLALQLRQNTSALHQAAARTHLDIWNGLVSKLVVPDMADVWYRGHEDISTLNKTEIVQFYSQMALTFRFYEVFFLDWSRGNVDDQLWFGHVQAMKDQFSQIGAHEWWKHRRHWFCLEFQDFVDSTRKEEKGHPLYRNSA